MKFSIEEMEIEEMEVEEMEIGPVTTRTKDVTPRECDCNKEEHIEFIQVLKHELRQKEAQIEQLKKQVFTLERRQLADSSVESEVQQKQHLELKNCAQTDKPEEKSEKCRIQQQSTPGDSQLVEHVEEMLSGGFRDIKSNLEKLIDDKLNGRNYQQNSFETSATSGQTYANAARNINLGTDIRDLCSVTLDENNQVLVEEEMDKKNRSRNFIIHGKTEDSANDDNNFVNNLFKDLQISAPPIKQIERIGKKLENREQPQKRPIIVVLDNEEDKNTVLENLKNLKGKLLYKGVRITNDYTLSQRLLIKDYYEKAQENNREEKQNATNFMWKVRGTPETGLTLRRFYRS